MTMIQIAIQCLCAYLCIFASVDALRRPKRIIGGSDLPDHNLYNTHFVVSLQRTHACVAEQHDHKLIDCTHNHLCGGSLIAVDFVMTACHCLIDERWITIVGEDTPENLPPYTHDRILNKPWERGDPLVRRMGVRVESTLHSQMTVFAGHPDSRKKAPQRRHSAKFFVHHLCGGRRLKTYTEAVYVIDVGLVKTCLPFRLNKDVQLAPFKPKNKMEEHLHLLEDLSATCLFVGWGTALKKGSKVISEGYLSRTVRPDILQHAFRHIQCNRDCTYDDHQCILCTRHHGHVLAASGSGDSGSPLICEGFVTAVHSRGVGVTGWVARNFSMARHTAVACVKDFISERQLSYLRSTIAQYYHYINGEPITES